MFLWLLTFYQTGPNGLFIFYQVFNLILQSALILKLKIDTVISFLIPEKDSKKHLQYLSNTAKLLTHQDFIEKLKKAQTPEEIKNLFANN